MTVGFSHGSLWTWPRINWVADTTLYLKWSLPLTLTDCPWNMFVWLGPSSPGWVHLLRGFSDLLWGELWQPHPVTLQTCLVLSPVKKAWAPARDSWNVTGKDKNYEKETQLLLTEEVKEAMGKGGTSCRSRVMGHQEVTRKSIVESNIWSWWSKDWLGTVLDFILEAKRNNRAGLEEHHNEG